MKHIKASHSVKSKMTTKRKESARSTSQMVATVAEYIAMQKDRPRAMAFEFIKGFILQEVCRLGIGEKEDVRLCWSVTTKEGFPLNGLHRKAVKHKIVELYNTTASRFRKDLNPSDATTTAKEVHLNFDLWTDKTSNIKYLGVRVWFVNKQWELMSRLLAVSQLNPSAAVLQTERMSDILRDYLSNVLKEFNLTENSIFSCTTDDGSDVRRLAEKLMPSSWEWCIAHILNCSLVEAFGIHLHSEKCRKKDAREVIGLVKKTIEHLRKSPSAMAMFQKEQVKEFGKPQKLINAAPQRRTSSSGVLERILVRWDAIHSTAVREAKENPIASRKTEIQELYSIIKPVSIVITSGQATENPSGAYAALNLAMLQVTTPNLERNLDILTPSKSGSGQEQHSEDGKEIELSASHKMQRPHVELTPVARVTRELLREAVESRWFRLRYKPDNTRTRDKVFDMQAICHPVLSNLLYIESMVDGDATDIRRKIEDQFLQLLVEAADEVKREPLSVVASSPSPAKKRARLSSGKAEPRTTPPLAPILGKGSRANVIRSNELQDLGLFKTVTDTGPPPATTLEKAQEERKQFRHMPGLNLGNLPPEGLLQFWTTYGSRESPLIARVARSLLAAPASSGRIERDFSSAGQLMSSTRSTMDAGWVEMILFLHGNKNLIPLGVPELTNDEALLKIPNRMKSSIPALESEIGDSPQVSGI